MIDEATRNRLLRRVDWRFLLPNPEPERSAVFGSKRLADAVAAISKETVSGGGATGCDLVVAANPSVGMLAHAASALAPGGYLYSEWRFGTSGGIRRRLQAAGFEGVRLYWAWPPPPYRPALFWLPLDAPGAVAYYLQSRPHVRGLAGPVRVVLGGAWWLLYRAGLMPFVSAIGRKPDDDGVRLADRGQIDHESATARRHVATSVPGEETGGTVGSEDALRPVGAVEVSNETARQVIARWEGKPIETLDWVLLTGGMRSVNKVVGLVFGAGEPAPRLAVKMTRVPESAPDLEGEAHTLRMLHARLHGHEDDIPRVLFVHPWQHILAVGETALKGVPLTTVLQPGTYRDLALQAADWLAALAQPAHAVPRAEWWERLVELVIAQFDTYYGEVLEPSELRILHTALHAMPDLPLVPEQRDFSPWNVLLDRSGRFVVLDWESAEIMGLPARDLVYFLTYLAFFHDGAMDSGTYLESYRRSRDRMTFTGSIMKECLERYCARIRVPTSAVRPLRFLTWMLHSASEYRRLAADAGSKPSPAQLEGSLFLTLLRDDLKAAE